MSVKLGIKELGFRLQPCSLLAMEPLSTLLHDSVSPSVSEKNGGGQWFPAWSYRFWGLQDHKQLCSPTLLFMK